MPDLSPDARAIVDAVQDLTRLTVALHGDFRSRSDAVRRLDELAIPAARIAAILSMPPGDVHSALSKAKKRDAADASATKQGRGRRSTTADAGSNTGPASPEGAR